LRFCVEAQVADDAFAALGLAGDAHVAAVEDQPVVGVAQVFLGDAAQQALLDFDDVLAGGEAGAVGEAEDVGVDGHRRFAEDGVEHHVGGLAADAGQGFEGVAVVGHFAAVALEQRASSAVFLALLR
jgi:hypothetical protein